MTSNEHKLLAFRWFYFLSVLVHLKYLHDSLVSSCFLSFFYYGHHRHRMEGLQFWRNYQNVYIKRTKPPRPGTVSSLLLSRPRTTVQTFLMCPQFCVARVASSGPSNSPILNNYLASTHFLQTMRRFDILGHFSTQTIILFITGTKQRCNNVWENTGRLQCAS